MGGTLVQAGNVRPFRVTTLLALVAVLAGCHTGITGAPWHSAVGREHRLVGRTWDVAGGQFVDETTVVARLVEARYVLLG